MKSAEMELVRVAGDVITGSKDIDFLETFTKMVYYDSGINLTNIKNAGQELWITSYNSETGLNDELGGIKFEGTNNKLIYNYQGLLNSFAGVYVVNNSNPEGTRRILLTSLLDRLFNSDTDDAEPGDAVYNGKYYLDKNDYNFYFESNYPGGTIDTTSEGTN